MPSVVIIDYGSGNLHSAAKALERANSESGAGYKVSVTADIAAVAKADRIILPGVGAFADCKNGLEAVPGLLETLTESVRQQQKPFLGICVGMQLMASQGLEFGTTPGLDWIEGSVEAIRTSGPSLKIPHMGWNTLDVERNHPLLDDIATGPDGLHAYFVHSYHFKTKAPGAIVAKTNYGGLVTAMVAKDNMAGTQFHPEKSQTLGLKLLANFLNWSP